MDDMIDPLFSIHVYLIIMSIYQHIWMPMDKSNHVHILQHLPP